MPFVQGSERIVATEVTTPVEGRGRRAGLAWNIKTADDLPHRAELQRLDNDRPGCCVYRMLRLDGGRV